LETSVPFPDSYLLAWKNMPEYYPEQLLLRLKATKSVVMGDLKDRQHNAQKGISLPDARLKSRQ